MVNLAPVRDPGNRDSFHHVIDNGWHSAVAEIATGPYSLEALHPAVVAVSNALFLAALLISDKLDPVYESVVHELTQTLSPRGAHPAMERYPKKNGSK
jgi:hypothetical protein